MCRVRKRTKQHFIVPTGAASNRLLGPNPRRTALIFSATFQDILTEGIPDSYDVGFGQDASGGNGTVIWANNPPFVFTYELVGDDLRGAVYAYASSGRAIRILEVFEVDDDEE